MYFIRNGKFSVHVNTEHFQFDGKKVKQVKPVTYLIEGDHFGEIGMLFDCKRTATVKKHTNFSKVVPFDEIGMLFDCKRTATVRSEGYGGLVILKKNDYAELAKTF